MGELATVGIGVALEKERQWLVGDDPFRAGKGYRALDDIFRAQRALRTQRLDALVIPISRTPAVRDLAQRARLGAQRYHRRVDSARLADGRRAPQRRQDRHVYQSNWRSPLH